MSPRTFIAGLVVLTSAACESASYDSILEGKACTSQGECAAGYNCVQGTCVTTWVFFPGEGGAPISSDDGGDAPSGAGGEGGTSCVVEGNCPPAQLEQGAACNGGADCVSGSCIDSVCCESGCTGACSACSAQKTGGPDGRCLPIVVNTDPDGECGAAYMTCNGAGACVCNDCNRPLGAACVGGPQCASGNCADGVCCSQPCGNGCFSCRADDTAEADGTCSPIEKGLDPHNECQSNWVCDGGGGCCNPNGNGSNSCDDD